MKLFGRKDKELNFDKAVELLKKNNGEGFIEELPNGTYVYKTKDVEQSALNSIKDERNKFLNKLQRPEYIEQTNQVSRKYNNYQNAWHYRKDMEIID